MTEEKKTTESTWSEYVDDFFRDTSYMQDTLERIWVRLWLWRYAHAVPPNREGVRESSTLTQWLPNTDASTYVMKSEGVWNLLVIRDPVSSRKVRYCCHTYWQVAHETQPHPFLGLRRRELLREDEWIDYGSDFAADGNTLESHVPLLLVPIPWSVAFRSIPCPLLQAQQPDKHVLPDQPTHESSDGGCCVWNTDGFEGVSEADLRLWCADITLVLLGTPRRVIMQMVNDTMGTPPPGLVNIILDYMVPIGPLLPRWHSHLS
jgi:hypothetical protein